MPPVPGPKPVKPTIHDLEVLSSQSVRANLMVSPGLMGFVLERAEHEGVCASKLMRKALYRYLGIKQKMERTE